MLKALWGVCFADEHKLLLISLGQVIRPSLNNLTFTSSQQEICNLKVYVHDHELVFEQV